MNIKRALNNIHDISALFMKSVVLLSIFCMSSYGALNAEKQLIERIHVEKNRLEVIVNKEFKEKYLTSDFFVEYDADIDLEVLDYSIQIMPFIMNVISIIWISGELYYIDAMDAMLKDSLERVKKVFKVLYPHTSWNGELKARTIVHNDMPKKLDAAEHGALLFSGGLDSTCSSYYIAHKKQLLITAWGQWDVPLDNENLWNERKNQLIEYAQKRGHCNAFLRSNYSSFLNRLVLDKLSPEIHSWRIDTVEGIGWAGLTAPILFSKGYSVLYLASSDTWDYKYPTAANPYVDNNIHFAGISLNHHLFKFSRFQKTEWFCKELQKKEEKSLFVKACLERSPHNCCDCTRCYVTAAALLALGLDHSIFSFQLDRIKMLENMKYDLLEIGHGVSYDLLFHIECIKAYLRKSEEEGRVISEDLRWLLGVEFEFQKLTDIAGQQQINWEQLDALFPHIKYDLKDEDRGEKTVTTKRGGLDDELLLPS